MTASKISVRDQREGTGLSDRVKEGVSLEYFTMSQRFKSPCEAHGMVRWGSPKTPSQIKR